MEKWDSKWLEMRSQIHRIKKNPGEVPWTTLNALIPPYLFSPLSSRFWLEVPPPPPGNNISVSGPAFTSYINEFKYRYKRVLSSISLNGIPAFKNKRRAIINGEVMSILENTLRIGLLTN